MQAQAAASRPAPTSVQFQMSPLATLCAPRILLILLDSRLFRRRLGRIWFISTVVDTLLWLSAVLDNLDTGLNVRC
jgi:hypothetical protein